MKPIEINVRLRAQTFREFSLFNTFLRTGLWRRIALFMGILAAFAVFCFTRPGGALPGGVLLGVALVLPAVYLGTFLFQVNEQIKKFDLSGEHPIYTVELTAAPDGIRIQSSACAQIKYAWADCAGAWRRADCTYLYVTQAKAFLLPHDQIRGGDADTLWALLEKTLPDEKLHRKG